MTVWLLLAAYLFVWIGAHFITGVLMWCMRWTMGMTGKAWRMMTFYVGGIERMITLTLVLWAPAQVPLFIGGWIALKMAANWQRQKGPEAAQGNLLALVGNALSFSIPIAVGLWLNPTALAAWNGE